MMPRFVRRGLILPLTAIRSMRLVQETVRSVRPAKKLGPPSAPLLTHNDEPGIEESHIRRIPARW